MRRVLLTAVLLAVGCGKGRRETAEPLDEPEPAPVAAVPKPAEDPPPLHSEQGKCAKLVVEVYAMRLGQPLRAGTGREQEMGRVVYHRLIVGEVLHGSQIRELDNHVLDQFQALTAIHPLDNIAALGALRAFNPRQEPMTYYHRSGPVGAMFRELRTRKGGADAKADIGVLGMKAGTEACYALAGQRLTFYETDPAIKRLVADTDKYFNYVAGARKRGAKIDVQIGDRRTMLKDDKDRRFALLLVDPYDSQEHPVDLLTKEAVQLYLDRMTEDGILAIDISSKSVNFAPMFARIAEELKLTARIWNDTTEGPPGKNWSSWMVLARSEKALGTLTLPVERQRAEYGSAFRSAETHPDVPAWTDKNATVVEAMKFKR